MIVKDTLTPLSRDEASRAFLTAYQQLTGVLPTPAVLSWAPVEGDAEREPMPPIGLHPSFAHDAARFCGDGPATVRVISPLRPLVFANGKADAWHLLMPIRLAG